jgi:type II secretory pathway component PulF
MALKKEKKTPEVQTKPVVKKRRKWSRFTGNGGEKEYFVDNLAMLLSSGMDILSALEAIKEGVRSKLMKGIIDDLKADITDGLPLWKALQKTKLLSLHILSLFRIGEESGKLAENLKVINAQQQKERIFRSKIHSAMMYPILVLSLTLVVGIGIAWFILPRLSVVFSQLNMELPLITNGIPSFSFLHTYILCVYLSTH